MPNVEAGGRGGKRYIDGWHCEQNDRGDRIIAMAMTKKVCATPVSKKTRTEIAADCAKYKNQVQNQLRVDRCTVNSEGHSHGIPFNTKGDNRMLQVRISVVEKTVLDVSRSHAD